MNNYKIIIFDLDDTLIDNLESVRYAYKKMVEEVGETYTEEGFKRWYKIDKKFWKDRQDNLIEIPERFKNETGKKSKEFTEWIRAQRAIIYFDNKISLETAINLNNIYMQALSENIIAIDGAYELLNYLKDKYKIVIATNGPEIATKGKLSKINCLDFVDQIFSAEMFGYMKPNKIFFDGIKKKLNNDNTKDYLIVGDSLKSDVEFAMNCGFDSCWLNSTNGDLPKEYHPTLIIQNLKELLNKL